MSAECRLLNDGTGPTCSCPPTTCTLDLTNRRESTMNHPDRKDGVVLVTDHRVPEADLRLPGPPVPHDVLTRMSAAELQRAYVALAEAYFTKLGQIRHLEARIENLIALEEDDFPGSGLA